MTTDSLDAPLRLRVPSSLLFAVDQRAKQEQLTRSELIRRALVAAVERAA